MAHHIPDANEKISYYRTCANRAGRSAEAMTDPDMRTTYLAIQRTWIYLADELEREVAEAGGSMIIADDDAFVPAATESRPHKTR